MSARPKHPADDEINERQEAEQAKEQKAGYARFSRAEKREKQIEDHNSTRGAIRKIQTLPGVANA
jgi:hypothetical protein